MTDHSTILFDFGGVLAEEGFREGLRAIGSNNERDPDDIFLLGKEIVFSTGYVVGAVGEAHFWNEFRCRSGIASDDRELRREILSRFIPRPEMFAAVRKLRRRGHTVAILSDQTNWLDELNDRYRFFSDFDRVFNSYYCGRSKQDPQFFVDVMKELKVSPHEVLFLDDDPGNLQRAWAKGVRGILVEESFDALRNLGAILGVDFH